MLDGFYIGYMSGQGYGVALFVFRKPNIVGVDATGVTFDGNYNIDPKDGSLFGTMTIKVPPNIDLIQGGNTGPEGLIYKVTLSIPENFLDAPFIHVDTPFGPVNVKLEKLRDLGGAA